MKSRLKLGDITVDVTLKDIKNIHLSVYPPTGAVRVSAPRHLDLDTIRVFTLSKLNWIRKQQTKLREQEREKSREYLDRESHYLWGKRYLLKVVKSDSPPEVTLKHSEIILQVRPQMGSQKRGLILNEWYRQILKDSTFPLVKKWETKLGVTTSRVIVQRMKTKWGSCTPASGIIRINLELAKKPSECLEYIIVHELLHMIEPSHNEKFITLMDKYLPKWKFYRAELNRMPVRHEDWKY